MLGAQYLSINSYRPFLVTPEHVHRTSCLNNYQTKKNPDGSITLVFARKDPGVYNWIDSGPRVLDTYRNFLANPPIEGLLVLKAIRTFEFAA